MCNLLIKQKILTTKTYHFTKLCKRDWVTYPKQQKIFFQESRRNELMAFSSVRSINSSEKKIFAVLEQKKIFAVLDINNRY